MDLKQIGQNVKQLRKQTKMTQAQLAERIDKSTNHIAHIEGGAAKMSLDTLLAICYALDTCPNEILQGEYEPKQIQSTEFLKEEHPYIQTEDRVLLIEIAEILARRNGKE